MEKKRYEAARAFICIELPDAMKRRISLIGRQLQQKGVRLVPEQKMHVTLVFIGEVNGDKIAGIKKAMDNADHDSFPFSVNGIGAFSLRRPDAVFAKVTEEKGQIDALHRQLAEGICRLGIDMDKRAYRPHITLARISRTADRDKITEFLEKHTKTEFGSAICTSIKLKKSVPSSSGHVYSDIYLKNLR